MSTSPRQTLTHLRQLFQQQGLTPRHALGQNFLIDLNLHDYVTRQAQLTQHDVVLEVGTGTGGLTSRLLTQAGHVVSVEYDRQLAEQARRQLGEHPRLTLLEGDALASKHRFSAAVCQAVAAAIARVKQDVEGLEAELPPREIASPHDDLPWELAPRPVTLKLVANLPYHIATPVISNMVASDWPWSRMVVTVQWELAERMQAAAGTGPYGALSIWLQAQTRIKILRRLPPQVFWPAPKVDSAIVLIERDHQAQRRLTSPELFHALIRYAFTQRRKRALKLLAQADVKEHGGEVALPADPATTRPTPTLSEWQHWFAQLGLSESVRPEQITVDQWVMLAEHWADWLASQQRRVHQHHSARHDLQHHLLSQTQGTENRPSASVNQSPAVSSAFTLKTADQTTTDVGPPCPLPITKHQHPQEDQEPCRNA
ncbi:MAG: hypothetical protein KatS3mg114_0363 [Planctomycetaceae bacterium]|nr:MAG: hypothetical protein KatS3mg114_0363 [Planctomycetaceae bacterium]